MAQAYDLEEVLDTVTFLEGRTIHTDTKGTFARVADYRDGGIFTLSLIHISEPTRPY